MSENRDFSKLEPVGASDDGQRHCQDEQAKQALIHACNRAHPWQVWR